MDFEAKAPGKFTIKISSAMVSAGTRVLRESGLLFAEGSADLLVVLRILETALAAHKEPRKRCKSESLGHETQDE
jgi:hypothetical protein